MKLTPKLLKALNRVFDKSPDLFVAFRINYDGGLAWTVADGVLAITVTGGSGASVTYDLSSYTLEALVAALAARTGFSVTFSDRDRQKRSARCLLDGAGGLSLPNGDALLGYTALLWSFIEAWAVELQRLRDQVGQALLQLSTKTAVGAWLVEIGSYYGVFPTAGESDPLYAQRIIAETLRPVSNNVAMEAAIEEFTGQACTVDDVVIYRGVSPIYDGTYLYDGTINYNTVGFPNYGLFDVSVAYDLILGGDITTFDATVRAIVEKLRAGGTFLRALALAATGHPITDTVTPPSDAGGLSTLAVSGTLADTSTAATDALSGLAMQSTGFADTLTAPSESVTGSVLSNLTTEGGSNITDEGATPLQARTAPLFI